MQENKIDEKFTPKTFKFKGFTLVPDPEQSAIIESPIDKSSIIVTNTKRSFIFTICCRIKHLIDIGISEDNILILTSRIEQTNMLKIVINELTKIKYEIMLIDSFCYKIIPKRNIPYPK